MTISSGRTSRWLTRFARISRSTGSTNRERKRRRLAKRLRMESLESRRLLAVVSGNVFFDVDASGVADGGESGEAGIDVVLVSPQDETVAGPVSTDANGDYAFSGIADGDYQVRLALDAGELQSAPGPLNGPGQVGVIEDAFATADESLVADPRPVSIVWANAALLAAEVTTNQIYAWDGNAWSEELVATHTDSVRGLGFDGTYIWAAEGNLTADGRSELDQYDLSGNYVASYSLPKPDGTRLWGVTFDGSNHWVLLEDSTNNTTTIERWSIDTVNNQVSASDVITLPGSPSTLGLDYRQGELWLSDRAADEFYAVDIAASIGQEAQIRATVPAPGSENPFPTGVAIRDGSLWSSDLNERQIYRISLGETTPIGINVAGTDVSGLDFGVSAPGSVAGVVYADADQSGAFDVGELPLDGWQVYIDANGDGQLTSGEPVDLTDAHGQYTLNDVLPGTQTVRIVNREPGWTLVEGASGQTQTVLAGVQIDVSFGAFQSGFAPVGGEVPVSSTGSYAESSRGSVAINENGYTAVVYKARPSGGAYGGDLYLQIYRPDGTAESLALIDSIPTSARVFEPHVTAVPGGGFAVAWSVDPDPNASYDNEGFITILDQTGNTQVATRQIGPKNTSVFVRDLNSNSSGELAVAFTEAYRASGPGSFTDVALWVERFNVDGSSLGKPVEALKRFTTLGGNPPSIALRDDAGFIVTYYDGGTIYYQLYNPNGQADSDRVAVAGGVSGLAVSNPSVVANSQGDFTLAWSQRDDTSSGIGEGKLLHFAAGSTDGIETSFGLGAPDAASDFVELALAADGTLGATWTATVDRNSQVFAQRFIFDSASGGMIGLDANSYVVNTVDQLAEIVSSVALGPSGEMAVNWTRRESDESHSVYLQRYTTPPPNLAPSVAISSPSNGATVAGTSVEIVANVSDADGVINFVEFFVNGVSIGTDAGDGGTAATVWDSTKVTDGTHEILVEATDDQGAKSSDVITVVVDNNAAPSVGITSPSEGATVVGLTTIVAGANDTDGVVSQVDFYLSNTLIGSDSDGSDGWSIDWDSTTVANGLQTLLAVATDDAGESTDSHQVTVNVDNPVAEDVVFVGDIDGTATNEGKNWIATVSLLVVDSTGNPVPDATVAGQWTGGFSGSATVTTDANGLVTLSSGAIRKNSDATTFTVSDVSASGLTYDAGKNTDPDGDSSGTSITVFKDGSTSPGQAMHASLTHAMSHPQSTLAPGRTLSLEAAERALDDAIRFWQESRGLQVDSPINLQVVDLPGQQLGWSAGPLLQLDVDGAGHGWALSTERLGQGGYDLLSVVTHEVGHFFGFGHDDEGVMSPRIGLHGSLLLDSIFVAASPVGLRPHSSRVDLEEVTRRAHGRVFSDAVYPAEGPSSGVDAGLSSPQSAVNSSKTEFTMAVRSVAFPAVDRDTSWSEQVDHLLALNFVEDSDGPASRRP